MPAAAKEQGVVRKGKTIIRPTRCTILPANSVIFPELLGLNLISFLWSSRGVDLFSTNHSLHQREDPEASLLPINPHHSPSGRTSASAPTPNRASCCTLFFRTGAPAVPPEGSSERDTQLSVLQVLPLTFLVSFLTSKSRCILTFSAIKEGGYLRKLSSVTRGKHSMATPSLDSLRAELRGDPPLQRQGKRGISQSSQGSCGTCSAMLQGDAFTSSKSVVQYSWKLT